MNIKTIDEQIKTLRAKVRRWRSELEKKTDYIDGQEAERAEFRHKALSDGDPKATEALAQLRQVIAVAREEALDLDNEIRDGEAEISRLEERREEAEREQYRQELIVAYDEMAGCIEKNPEPLTVSFIKQRWIPFCKFAADRRAKLGLNPEVPDHLPIKYYQGAFFPLFPRYVTKPHEKYINKAFSQLFREHRRDFTGETPGMSEELTAQELNATN